MDLFVFLLSAGVSGSAVFISVLILLQNCSSHPLNRRFILIRHNRKRNIEELAENELETRIDEIESRVVYVYGSSYMALV